MSSSQAHDDQRQVPTQMIHERYHNCIQARERWFIAGGAGGQQRESAHQVLQQAVLSYYEAARHLLTGAQDNVVKAYWAGTEGYYLTWERVGDVEGDVHADDVDVDVEVRYHGLQSLEEWFDVSEVSEQPVTGSGSLLSSHTTEQRSPSLLDPDLLFRAARQIDDCLQRLDVLTRVNDELQMGGIQQ